MKSILSLNRHHYLRTVSIFLIAVILIAGVVGCEGEADKYDLTMAVDPTGAGTATDLTGGSPYEEGTEATIQAVAASCYRFVNWSAPAGTFDDPNAATTNFTMPAQDVTVTANFELKPVDHYRIYDVDWETAPLIGEEVQLVDQFGAFNKTVGKAEWFGNPVDKTYNDELTPMSDENNHLTFYWLEEEEPYVLQSVEVTNQFGTHNLSVFGPIMLAVPTQKLVPGDHDKWDCVDHFSVYEVINYEEIEGVNVDLDDQFGPEQGVPVYAPVAFAVPVQKTCGSETTYIENPNLENHLVIYSTGLKEHFETVVVSNQFLNGDDQTLNLEDAELLAVPSQKIVPPTPSLDHFKGYPLAAGPDLEEVYVDLEDQFDYYSNVEVTWPWMFCNPVKKNLEPIVNPDNHLTLYALYISEPLMWTVTVDNQFGDDQVLIVEGPTSLAVPTQKLVPGDHEPPEYLDHYLLYAVNEYSDVTATVDLDDQFPGAAPGVEVIKPMYLATPAAKVHEGYATFPWNPEGHLVFYLISYNEEFYSGDVEINNQFQQASFSLIDDSELLAVPSVKVSYEPYIPP